MVVVSARHVSGTGGSGIVSSTADMEGMSVVCGVRGVGGVCEMCMYLARGGVGGEGELMGGLGLGLDFTNPVGTGGVLSVCLYLCCSGLGGVGGQWVGGLDQGLEVGDGVMSV